MKKTLLLLLAILAAMSGAQATSTLYSVANRATSLSTGKKYFIYNSGGEDYYGSTRQFFLYASGSSYAITTSTAPLTFTTTSEAYLWELEEGASDGTYKIKNIGTGTYYAGGAATLGDTGVDCTITDFSTLGSNRGSGLQGYYLDDGTRVAYDELTSTDYTYGIYSNDSGDTSNPYWNGRADAFCLGARAHAYVFYEVSEAAIPLDDGMYTVTYSKTSSYTCYMKPDFTFTNTKLSATATAGDGGVFKFTRVDGTADNYYIMSLDGGYLYANGVASVSGTAPYQYHNAAAISSNTEFSSSDDKFKWVLEETAASSGLFYIKPKSNTNTALAVYRDVDGYFSFYLDNGSYDFAQATLAEASVGDEDAMDNFLNYTDEQLAANDIGITIGSVITSYISAHSLATLPAGAVGYPTDDAALISAYGAVLSTPSKATYVALRTAYEAYLQDSNIKMPEDGHIYTFTNVQAPSVNKSYYLNSSAGTMTSTTQTTAEGATATEYICHYISDTQYAFISLNDWYWMIAASNASATVSQTYDSYAPLTLSRFYDNCNTSNTSEATAENTLGLFQIKGSRKNVSDATTSVALVNAAGGFNDATSAYFNGSYSSAYRIEESLSSYYNKVTLTSDGTDAYASIYLPIAVDLPTGVTAYAVTSQDGTTAHMDEIVTAGTLPANTAAILKKSGQTENETVYLSPATSAGSYEGTNLLSGTVDTVTRASLGSGSTYVLGNIDGIGLYTYTADNMACGKAYLFIAGGDVKSLTLDFGSVPTAVGGLTGHAGAGATVYDLSGRRVATVARGIYLHNGKKYVVK